MREWQQSPHARLVTPDPRSRTPNPNPDSDVTRRSIFGSAIAALLALGAPPAFAAAQVQNGQPPARASYDHAQAPSVQITRTTAPIRIDGVLDEEAWQQAPPIAEFTQMEPNEGQPGSQRTEFRLLLGDDALYIGARLHEADPSRIRARLARRDEAVDGDVIGVYLDSRHDHISAYYFRVSAGGAMRDAIISETGGMDLSWDAVWEAAVARDSLGWTAELRIPLSQIAYARDGDGIWGLQLDRFRWNDQERLVFAYSPRTEAQGPPRYGHLTGLTDLPSPQRLELLPYVTARSEHRIVGEGNPFRSGSDQFADVGGDLRFRVTPELNFNATLNPDFGQVEVDPAVVNLTAVETFLTERRPFFVEGRQRFNFGTTRAFNLTSSPTMFHTRRIGRTPQRFVSGRHVDRPEAATIAGAAKLTGRIGGWSVAVLDAVTMREDARVIQHDGEFATHAVEPLTNYFVGRLRREMAGGNTQIGGYMSTVHRDLADSVLTIQLRSQAYAAGADFSHSWDNRRWNLDGYLIGSQVIGSDSAIFRTQLASSRYYQRPDAAHLQLDPGRTSLDGYSGRLVLTRSSGTHWIGSLAYQETSPGFEVNDIGFQTSADRRAVSPLIGYRETQPGRIFRNFFLGYFNNLVWNFGGDRIFAGNGAILEGQFLNFWNVNLRGDYKPGTYDDRLTRGGPLTRDPENFGASIWIGSDPRNRVLGGTNISHNWNNQGMERTSVYLSLTYQPSPTVKLGLEPFFFTSRVPAQYLRTVVDAAQTETFGARYLFADLDQQFLELTTRVDWTFSPRLSLQVYLQPLVSAGEYTRIKQLSAPRTFEFDVFGEDIGTIEYENGVYTIRPEGEATVTPITVPDPNFNIRSLRGNAVLRWEYRPGSTLYFVWQQQRFGFEPFGDFAFSRDYGAIFSARPENVFAVKATYWITR